MTTHDIYLLSPEISIIGLAIILLILDLVLTRKGALAIVAFVGLSAPLALSLMLWMDLNDEGSRQMGAVFGTLVVDKFSLFFKFLFFHCIKSVAFFIT